MGAQPKVVCLGGGHGLAATLAAMHPFVSIGLSITSVSPILADLLEWILKNLDSLMPWAIATPI